MVNTTKTMLAGPVLALAIFLFGCASELERVEKQLINSRAERTQLVDALYADYGGGSLAVGVNNELQKAELEAGTGGVAGMLKGMVSEGDRTIFEGQIRHVGSGERLVAVSGKAKAFFAREDVKQECTKLVLLDARIESLTQKKAKLRSGQ